MDIDDQQHSGVAGVSDRRTGDVRGARVDRSIWKPFYFLLDDALNVMLVNARHVRNVPGRKTDVSDAAWLAELGAHGLVRASFVPPEPIRC